MQGSCESFEDFVHKGDHLSDLKISCNIRCVHLDLASNFAGTLLGITNCAANMMGVVAPAVAGYLTQDHSDAPHWRVVFFVAALVYIVGNTIFLVWGSAKEQSWNRGLAAGGHDAEDGEDEDPYAGLDD